MIFKTKCDLAGLISSATFSEDMAYRYDLTWKWSDGPTLVFWLLNPSTATHEIVDPTVSGLIRRARKWGYGGICIINLFAYRATEPSVMRQQDDPIGPDNDPVIRAVLHRAADDGVPVIAGWGAHGNHRARDRAALAIAKEMNVQLFALKTNLDGSPQHPLYIGHEVRPVPWSLD